MKLLVAIALLLYIVAAFSQVEETCIKCLDIEIDYADDQVTRATYAQCKQECINGLPEHCEQYVENHCSTCSLFCM